MTNDHSARAHSLLGGSTAHRWTNCTGSVFYLMDLPPQEAGEAAIEGTAAHEVAEKFIEMFLETQISGKPSSLRIENVSDEMLSGAEFYQASIWKELLDEAITGKAYGLEEKFIIDTHLDMGGIVDFWAVYVDDKAKRTGVVADYKFGATPVVALKNAQLAFYAVALRKEMQRNGKDLDQVYGAIIQPRLLNEKMRFQKVKFTSKQLDVWEKKFYAAAESIYVKKHPKFKVGDWCKFCPAKAICTTYNKDLHTKTALKLAEPEEVKLPVPETMSKEALSKIVLHYDQIKDFIDSCYTHVLNSMKNGKKFDGLKLVSGTSRRKWKEDEAAILSDLQDHLTLDKMQETKLKGITALEKELASVVGKNEAKEILSKHTIMSTPSITIVQNSDPRPAVQNQLDKL